MSELWAITIFSVVATILCGLVGCCFLMLVSMRERIVALESRNEFEDRRLAGLSHSPHDPYGWDSSIDKYLDRNYEMSMNEWGDWLHDCEIVVEDNTKPLEDRKIAARLAAVCWHKLMMPPPVRKKIEQAADKVEDEMAIMVSEKKKEKTL